MTLSILSFILNVFWHASRRVFYRGGHTRPVPLFLTAPCCTMSYSFATAVFHLVDCYCSCSYSTFVVLVLVLVLVTRAVPPLPSDNALRRRVSFDHPITPSHISSYSSRTQYDVIKCNSYALYVRLF